MQSRKLKHKKKSWEYVLVQQVVQRDRCSLTGGAARKDGWGRTETERDDNQMLQLDGWNQAFISRRPNILPAPATTVARRRYQLQLAQSQVPLIDKVSLCIPSSWKITNNTGSDFCFVLLETCDGPNWIYYILVEFNRKRRGQTTPGRDLTTDFTFLLTADRRVRHRRGGRRDDGAGRGEEHRGVWLARVGGHLVSLGVRRH